MSDLIENKYDQMKNQFAAETITLKTRYEDSIILVSEASKNLGTLFSDKMLKIKEKISKWFGSTDMRLETANRDILEVTQIV